MWLQKVQDLLEFQAIVFKRNEKNKNKKDDQ